MNVATRGGTTGEVLTKGSHSRAVLSLSLCLSLCLSLSLPPSRLFLSAPRRGIPDTFGAKIENNILINAYLYNLYS